VPVCLVQEGEVAARGRLDLGQLTAQLLNALLMEQEPVVCDMPEDRRRSGPRRSVCADTARPWAVRDGPGATCAGARRQERAVDSW
jgi:hypothetical protein